MRNVQYEMSPLLTRLIQSQRGLHTLNKSVAFQLHFIFLEIIKHSMPKMLLFFHLKTATQKLTNFDVLLKMHADMTQSQCGPNKIVSMLVNTTNSAGAVSRETANGPLASRDWIMCSYPFCKSLSLESFSHLYVKLLLIRNPVLLPFCCFLYALQLFDPSFPTLLSFSCHLIDFSVCSIAVFY